MNFIFMEFIFFAGVIVLIFLFFNLRGRVEKLEQIYKHENRENETKIDSRLNFLSPAQPRISEQSAVDNLLIDYIRQQLNYGISREEIANSLLLKGWNSTDIEKALSLAVPPENSPQSINLDDQVDGKLIKWLKEDWMLKFGALLLLIGFGWLATYAFLNNWIGPMGRIALGIVAGVFFMILGWWRIKKYSHQGGVFLVLGSTTILLTIFAAREIYDFFTPLSALAVMFLSTAFVAFVSVKHNSRSLSLLGLALAGVAPLFINAPTPDYVSIFTYLLVVVLGAIWIVILTGRKELTFAALLLFIFYSMPHIFSLTSGKADIGVLLIFAYAFAAIFFITGTAELLKSRDEKITPSLLTALINGLFLLVWIMFAAQDEWKSLIISAWMIVFGVGSFLIFKATRKNEPFYVYAVVGIAMLAAATYSELSGAMLTIAYTIESGIIMAIVYAILRDIHIIRRLSVLLIGPVVLSMGNIFAGSWDSGVWHKDFLALFILGLTCMVLALFFRGISKDAERAKTRQFNAWLWIVGSVYFYILLWLSLHAGLENMNTAAMISLIVYTIVGLVLYFYGFTRDRKGFLLYGGLLIGFVIGRMLLVDIWHMELAGRIVTFFIIGAMLVSTAFLGKNKKKQILS